MKKKAVKFVLKMEVGEYDEWACVLLIECKQPEDYDYWPILSVI